MSETAQFPGAVTTQLHQVEARTTTYLTNDIDNSQLNIAADTTGFPAKGFITIESETNEYLSLTALQFNVVSPRGYAGTAVSHLAGKAIKLSVAAATMNRVIAEVTAIETSLGASLANIVTSGGWIVTGTSTFIFGSPIVIVASYDVTYIQKSDKIRYKQGGAYKYGYIISITDQTTSWAIGVAGDTVANAAITDFAYSHIENPLGFPGQFNWIPTLTGGNADLSGYDSAIFTIHNLTVYFEFIATGKNVTGTADSVQISLPVSGASGNMRMPLIINNGSAIDVCVALVAAQGGILYVYKNATSGNWVGNETGVDICARGSYQF